MGDLGTRILTVLILVPIVLGVVLWGGMPFALAVLLLGWFTSGEALRLRPQAAGTSNAAAQALIVMGIVVLVWYPRLLPVLFMLPLLLLFQRIFSQRSDWQTLAHRWNWDLMVFVYMGSFAAWIPLRFHPLGDSLFLIALGITWINDTFAYLFGSRFGRRKLVPALSPNKSWEGALAGLLGGAAVGVVVSVWVFPGQIGWIPISFCLAGMAQLGDLFESFLKRAGGVKDSGHLLPGHGGLLDRIDSLLFVLPWMLVVARMLF